MAGEIDEREGVNPQEGGWEDFVGKLSEDDVIKAVKSFCGFTVQGGVIDEGKMGELRGQHLPALAKYHRQIETLLGEYGREREGFTEEKLALLSGLYVLRGGIEMAGIGVPGGESAEDRMERAIKFVEEMEKSSGVKSDPDSVMTKALERLKEEMKVVEGLENEGLRSQGVAPAAAEVRSGEDRAREAMRRVTRRREAAPPAEPRGPSEKPGSLEKEGEIWLINSLQKELLIESTATEGLVPSLPVSVDEARRWLGAPDRDKVFSGMRYLAVFGEDGDRQEVWDLDKKLRMGETQLNLLNVLTVRFMEIYSRSIPKEYRGQIKVLAGAIRREIKLLALISPVMLGLKQSSMNASGVSVDNLHGAAGVNKVVEEVLKLINTPFQWKEVGQIPDGGTV